MQYASSGTTENLCELFYWTLCDANYNVLGLVNKWGMLIERYEYTPYGQRQVFSHGRVLGDTDQDGDVDLTDLGNFGGASGSSSVCDFDGDGDIDEDDEDILTAAYGTASLSLADPLVLYPTENSFRGGYLAGAMNGTSPIIDAREMGVRPVSESRFFSCKP